MTSRPARVPGRLIAWTALLVALGASVGANVAYARPEAGPRITAGIAPVLVVLGAALLERVPLAAARWWQRWLAGTGLVFVVAAAFVTSYQHQRALLASYGNPELSSTLLPLAVDALVLMASVCLAVIADLRRAALGVPAPGGQAVPALPPVATERVDPLGLDGRDAPESAPEPAGTPEPVPAPAKPKPWRPLNDQQVVAVLKDPEAVPVRDDGTVAVEYVQREFRRGQAKAVELLQKANRHRAREGESVPGDVDEDVPADEQERQAVLA